MNATAFMTRRPKKIKNRAASNSATRKMGVASPLGSRLEGMLSGGLVMLQRVTRKRLTVERSPSMEFQFRAIWFCNRRVLPDPISLEIVFAEALLFVSDISALKNLACYMFPHRVAGCSCM